MGLAYYLASKLPNRSQLLSKHRVDWFDFVALILSKFVEPDPVPWFKALSSGNFLVLLWTCFSLCVVLFFQSNLRSVLMVRRYEKLPTTNYGIQQSNRRVYIPIQNYEAK